MNYDKLWSFDRIWEFMSPVTGRILCDPNYILVGDVNGIATPSPILIDMTLDLINLRASSFIVGFPEPRLPNAQVLSYLDDGIMFNQGGEIITTGGVIPPGSLYLPENKLFRGDATNRATHVQRIELDNLPSLRGLNIEIAGIEFSIGQIYMGDSLISGEPIKSFEHSIAIASTLAKFEVGPFVLNGSTNPAIEAFLLASFGNAQILNIDFPEGGIAKIMPITGLFEIAIPNVDYATMAAMEEALAEVEELAAQAEASAAEAAASAEEATAAAAEALVDAEAAAASAAEALIDAGAAAASAALAAASAAAAGGSAAEATAAAAEAAASAATAATYATIATGAAATATAAATAAAISAAAAAASAASITGQTSACNTAMIGNNTSTTVTTGGTYTKILGTTTTALAVNFSASPPSSNRMVYTGTVGINLVINYNALFSPSGIPVYVTIYKNGIAIPTYCAPMAVTPGVIGGSVSMNIIVPAVTNDYFEAFTTTATSGTGVTVINSNFTAINIL